MSYYMSFQEVWGEKKPKQQPNTKKKKKGKTKNPTPFSHKLTKTSLLFMVALQFVSWRHTAEDAKALATLLLN